MQPLTCTQAFPYLAPIGRSILYRDLNIGLPTRVQFERYYDSLPSPGLFREEYRMRCGKITMSLHKVTNRLEEDEALAQNVRTIRFYGRIIGRKSTMDALKRLMLACTNARSLISDNTGTAGGDDLLEAIAQACPLLQTLHLYKVPTVSRVPEIFASKASALGVTDSIDSLTSIIIWNIDVDYAALINWDLGPVEDNHFYFANPLLRTYKFLVVNTHNTYVLASYETRFPGDHPKHYDAILMSAHLI